MNNFDMACKVADAASYLDALKNTRSPAERKIAAVHVENLHDAAEHLAGERVGEIYADDDSSNVVRLAMCAGMCGCDES